MTTEVLTHYYTTQAEVERAYSSTGVTLALDDLSGSKLRDFWVDIRSETTDFFNQYCEMYYDPEDLVDSVWVRSRAKWVGAYYVSMRRGNPAIFRERFEQIERDLLKIYNGSLMIPRLPTREDMTPAMSNLTVDPVFRHKQLRVYPDISTGGTSSRQDIAFRYPQDWL